MSGQYAQTIEFFGGPIDGHRAEFQLPLKSLIVVQTAMPPKHRNPMVQLLCWLCFVSRVEPAVLAIYELAPRRSGNRYRYLRSTTSAHLKLDASRVYATVHSEDQTLKPLMRPQEPHQGTAAPESSKSLRGPHDVPPRRDFFEQRDS